MDRQIRAVLFDLDDTLLDWSGWVRDWPAFHQPRLARIYQHLLATGFSGSGSETEFCAIFNELSESCWAEAAQNGWRIPSFATLLAQTLTRAGFTTDDIDLETLMRVYDWSQMPGVVAFPEAIPVLRRLREAGYQLGLLTNSYFPMWMRAVEMRAFGLWEYFDAGVTSGDIGWLKPHPTVYWRLLEQMDLQPHEAVFVGDSLTHDIAGANGVGLTSILHAPPSLTPAPADVEPDYTIANLTELLPILAELEGNES